MTMENGLTIAMLGWRARATTRHTLESWVRTDLFHCGEEFFIYFNQRRLEDEAMAAEFGVDCRGTEENLGIWGGKEAILDQAKGDYILFLDDDHDAVVSREKTKHWVDASLVLLKSGKADAVILLDRFERLAAWGDSHFFDYHYIRELDPRAEKSVALCPKDWNRDTPYRFFHRLFRPDAARRRLNGAAPYLEKHPERVWPQYIRKDGDFFVLDSAIQPFCDSPVMISCKFYRQLCAWARSHPCHRTILGFQELEYVLNCRWWRQQHFRIAICDGGIFGHHRVDDSWRSDHEGFNSNLVTDGWKK